MYICIMQHSVNSDIFFVPKKSDFMGFYCICKVRVSEYCSTRGQPTIESQEGKRHVNGHLPRGSSGNYTLSLVAHTVLCPLLSLH